MSKLGITLEIKKIKINLKYHCIQHKKSFEKKVNKLEEKIEVGEFFFLHFYCRYRDFL